jgi:hypothetical protein
MVQAAGKNAANAKWRGINWCSMVQSMLKGQVTTICTPARFSKLNLNRIIVCELTLQQFLEPMYALNDA